MNMRHGNLKRTRKRRQWDSLSQREAKKPVLNPRAILQGFELKEFPWKNIEIIGNCLELNCLF